MSSTYQQGTPIEIHDTFTVSGVETDPTTVVYTFLTPDGTTDTFTWPGAPEIDHPSTGVFVLGYGAPALPGFYTYDVDATGAVTASRTGSFVVLPNAAIINDFDWALHGPCTPWVSSQAVWECCGQPMTTLGEGTMETECPVDMSPFAASASQSLFELSGRQFAGICEKTVRPCGTHGCGFQVLSRGHVVWDPFWTGASWGSHFEGAYYGCGCQALDRILLSGYPVREITEVLIDGVVVDPTTYRLDERRYLVRVADPLDPDVILLWPSCQRMDLPDDQAGTFSVTYRYGGDPPLAAVDAAAELACELYKACTTGECAMPTGATRITRQGVIIERLTFTAWGRQQGIWRTGLPRVDAFLNAYNPAGLRRRPAVWGPGRRQQYARTVGQ